jgi:phospholipase/carboxylesterase
MQHASSPLKYRVFDNRDGRASAPLMILLHGYGADESDLATLAPDLNLHFRVIAVRAPRPLYWGGFSWYSIQPEAHNIQKMSHLGEAEESLALLQGLMEELHNTYIPPRGATWILGFSQGAILGQAYALHHPQDIQGVVALSGYLWEDILPQPWPTHPRPEVYQTHGILDPVIPISLARNSQMLYKQNRWPHQYAEYEMGHTISAEAWEGVLAYLGGKGLI